MATGDKVHGLTITGGTTGAIADIYSFNGVNVTAGDVNRTTLSITDNHRKFSAGLLETDDLEIGVEYDRSNHATWYALIGGATEEYTIDIPDSDATNSTLVFDGYVKAVNLETPDADDDEILRATITIKVTEKPVFTEGSDT